MMTKNPPGWDGGREVGRIKKPACRRVMWGGLGWYDQIRFCMLASDAQIINVLSIMAMG